MSKAKEKTTEQSLEERKVRALEIIAASTDAIAIWLEEIDRDEWDERLQFYLHEFHQRFVKGADE